MGANDNREVNQDNLGFDHVGDEELFTHLEHKDIITQEQDKENKERNDNRLDSYRKFFAVVTFSCANFSGGTCYSLLGPFFPQQALLKGMNATLTGLVIGWFELIAIMTSPIFGHFMVDIGAKFLYVSGLCVAGISAILFGVLEFCPPGITYIVMCFMVRSVQGVGSNAFQTASYAIIATYFPNNVASMISILGVFYAVGLLVGPSLGGVLYQFGRFKVPFITMGMLNLLTGLISMCVLYVPGNVVSKQKKSFLFLLKLPTVLVMVLVLSSTAACIGFVDVGLALRLQNVYDFSALKIAMVFLIGPLMYGITAPLFGYIADKYVQYSLVVVCICNVVTGMSFLIMGHPPFIPISNDMLWLQLLTLVGVGIGMGSIIFFYKVVLTAALAAGMEENLETRGLISGLMTLFYSVGTFLGPICAGYLLDSFNFAWTAFAFGSLQLVCGCIVLSLFTITNLCEHHQNKQDIEMKETTLLKDADKLPLYSTVTKQ